MGFQGRNLNDQPARPRWPTAGTPADAREAGGCGVAPRAALEGMSLDLQLLDPDNERQLADAVALFTASDA